jgi:hypothetical protein
MTAQLTHIWSSFSKKDKADALLLHSKVTGGDRMAMSGLIVFWNRYGAIYSGEMNMTCPKCVSKVIAWFNEIANEHEHTQTR